MTTYRKFRDAVIERLKENPAEADTYLPVALETFEEHGDTEHLLLALRTVTEAQGGVPEPARRVGLEKMTLYNALSEEGNPMLGTS